MTFVKRVLILLFLLGLTGMMAGCGEETPKKPARHYPVTVGEVTVKAMPQKAVSLSPSATDIIDALGNTSKLVGLSDSCTDTSGRNLPKVGSSVLPDINQIITLGANVLFVSRALPATEAERCRTNDVTVILVPYAASLSELKALYTDIARVFAGNTDGPLNADATWSRFETQLGTAVASPFTTKTAAFVISPTLCFTPDSVVGELLVKAGATNIAASTGNAFTYEQVAAANPAVLFCYVGQKATILSNALLKNTDAVKNGQVFEIDPKLTERQGAGLLTLAEQLHAPFVTAAPPAESTPATSTPPESAVSSK